jgi:hypothetical protein
MFIYHIRKQLPLYEKVWFLRWFNTSEENINTYCVVYADTDNYGLIAGIGVKDKDNTIIIHNIPIYRNDFNLYNTIYQKLISS